MEKREDKKILVAQNKKAMKDFFMLDRYEAGIALMGCEVKSIRENKVNLKDCYARIKNGEIFIYNMHISPYSKSRIEDVNPKRVRKLLLHRKEINKIAGKLTDKSLTMIPLNIFMVHGLVKVEIATAKSKLKRDKRRDIEERESKIEVKRALKYQADSRKHN
ncbi:MAG: SsrA-binding protein SmpB [Actinobacteria bacterium]|nr:SsrA-binding protein SmpB [Actinomycetota bacterium]MBU4450393.1 SsrA-binding protein SmpB [Actinomycetota bacterium]MCG2789175.1 SsrA-binding protein SmpB [Actinomycetes bacterium]